MTRTVRSFATDLMTGGATIRRVELKAHTAPESITNRKRHKSGAAGGAPQYTAQNNNADQMAVLAMAMPMIQQVNQQSFAAANSALGQQITVVLNNVGLNTKLTVEVSGSIAQAAAETLTKTQLGLSNIFTNVSLFDLSNYQRVNTPGWHLHLLATLRRQAAFGAAFTNDSPVNTASNYSVCTQPSPVTTVQAFRMFFEIPLAYTEQDLRGAIWANVTSAQWRLVLTVNPNIVVPSNSPDPTLGVWQSSTVGNLGLVTNFVVTTFQHYLDQLPMRGNASVVPVLSLAWNYLIQTTTLSGLVAGADFTVQYANYRTFLSTIFAYDNAGTLNAGTDINYIAVQVANLAFLRKYDPFMASLLTRQIIGDDFPRGFYCIDHRRRPIVTNQYGNTQLVVNPSAVTAGASLMIGFEMLAVQAQAINAGSLA